MNRTRRLRTNGNRKNNQTGVSEPRNGKPSEGFNTRRGHAGGRSADSGAGDSKRPSYGSEEEMGEKHEEPRGSCGVPPAEPGARWESLKETGRRDRKLL